LSVSDESVHADAQDLARFGYKQELRRVLGVYSSFAVAFSYISPSTGIFTLFALGIGLAGPSFFWSWPIVVIGQLIIGLNFAEVSSHFPVDQVPLESDVCMVHRLDLPVRGRTHRGGRRRDCPTRADPAAQQCVRAHHRD
jgi:hypothetical protein